MQVLVSGSFSGGQYSLDFQDIWESYRWVIETGGDDLLQLPKSKEVYTKDWKGQSGKQYDLSRRYFDDVVATMSGYIIADNEEDFWNRYAALWEVLKAPGYRTIYSFELKRSFSVFYLNSPNAKKITSLQDHPGKIAMKLDVQFQVAFSDLTEGGSLFDNQNQLIDTGILIDSQYYNLTV